jgi:glycosyltransferase involved in cell wall biosynthesis
MRATAASEIMPAANSELTLTVVIPALNEEGGIRDVLDRTLRMRGQLRMAGVDRLEIIVVDDGSTDGTAPAVEGNPEVRLVKHGRNRGYGAAIKTGFGVARGQLLAFLDADSTYPPECLVSLCRAAIQESADVVVGSRRSGVKSSMPWVRRIGNLLWSTLLSLLGAPVQDPASGMRVLWKSSLRRLYPLPDGLNFTPVMSTRAVHEGLKVLEIGIPYHERSGRSKLNVVHDGCRFLNTIVWTVLEYNPARVLELVGSVALAVSVAIGTGLVIARLAGITQLQAWGVFAVCSGLVLGVGGVGVFALGISFNYLVALFHHHPIRQTGLLGVRLERHFGKTGSLLLILGLAIAAASLALGLQGWDEKRLWLWLLGAALFQLVGVQLILFRILVKVLSELNDREARVGEDLNPVPDCASVIPKEPALPV